MATTKRKKASGIGTAIYVVLLVLWILFLSACGLYVLNEIWEYASVYDQTQIDPVIEDYYNRLQTNMWTDGMDVLVRTMPHPTKTDAEVKELIQTKLRENPLSYAVKPGFARSDSVTYNILCGADTIGEVVLTHDTTVNLVQDIDLPSAVVGVLAKRGVAIQPELYPWKVAEESFDFSGLYSSVSATVPESYTVTLNGVKLDEGYIVERDIPFDVLEAYYYRYDNLPTKVTYQFDNLMGHLDPVVYDANGELTVIDKEANDAQFLKPVDDETWNRLAEHLNAFSDAYLNLSASTGDPISAYARLEPYIEAGSELDTKLRQVFLIGDWSHNSYYQYQGFELLNAWQLDQNCYVAEYRASATVNQPAGPVALDRTFRSVVDASGDHMITATIDDI